MQSHRPLCMSWALGMLLDWCVSWLGHAAKLEQEVVAVVWHGKVYVADCYMSFLHMQQELGMSFTLCHVGMCSLSTAVC